MDKELFQYLNQETIKINRDDIEQALSWYARMPLRETTQKDNESYSRLLSVTHKMRALGINDD